MKKLTLLFLLAGILAVTARSTELKKKDVVGSWNYSILTEQTSLKGTFKIIRNNKILEGEIIDDQGQKNMLSGIVIKNDKLIFEFHPNEHVLVVELKKENKNSLSGIVYIKNVDGSFKITAQKDE